MIPVSVCIIARNEEKHIEECCSRLQHYGFEIVLADTGSTDRTIELARKYTSHIYHFDWCDDFSAAKNFVIQKASHDWILSLDCDEYIETIDQAALQKCMEQYPHSAGRILIRNRFTENGQTSYEQVRVSRFVNRQYFHFEGAVHEQLVPGTALRNAPENSSSGNSFSGAGCPDTNAEFLPGSGHSSERQSPSPKARTDDTAKTADDTHGSTSGIAPVKQVYPAPITVLHVGYDGSEEEMLGKARRNIVLLEKELERQGEDPYLCFQLGQSYRRLHDYEKAVRYFEAGLAMDVDPALDYVQTMVESYGYTLLDLKRSQDALNLLGVYEDFSGRADFVFLMGLIYMNNGLFNEAINEFQKATTVEEFAVDGVNSYKAYYNIGVIYECAGYPREAREAYLKCGNYMAAKERIKQLSL